MKQITLIITYLIYLLFIITHFAFDNHLIILILGVFGVILNTFTIVIDNYFKNK